MQTEGRRKIVKLKFMLIYPLFLCVCYRDLIPKGYFERTQRENKTVVHRPSYEEVDVCHYHGKIRGHPQSWAALSTCDDVIRYANYFLLFCVILIYVHSIPRKMIDHMTVVSWSNKKSRKLSKLLIIIIILTQPKRLPT